MKRRTKKLVLSRQTLRNLQDGDLDKVAGGTLVSVIVACESNEFVPDAHIYCSKG